MPLAVIEMVGGPADPDDAGGGGGGVVAVGATGELLEHAATATAMVTRIRMRNMAPSTLAAPPVSMPNLNS
jgi:hypothetical protein